MTDSITVYSAHLVGVDARIVPIKISSVDPTGPGHFLDLSTARLPDAAAKELYIRVRSALAEIGEPLVGSWKVELPEGQTFRGASGFDLPVAMGIRALRAGNENALAGAVVVGELSLSGDVRSVRGIVPILEAADRNGAGYAIAPASLEHEARFGPSMPVWWVGHLRDLAESGGGADMWLPEPMPALNRTNEPELADIAGMEAGKLALETAVATGKNLLLIGPPGSGKTMLARRATSIMPGFTSACDRREIARIASAAGLPVTGARPFRAPHHTASTVAIVGGGSPVRPGEMTLAHGGVIFLDELPEMARASVEAIRSIAKAGRVCVQTKGDAVIMPAKPLIIGAMNPCPCGYRGMPTRECTCKPDRIRSYFDRVAPLREIFELAVILEPVPIAQLKDAPKSETGAEVRARIASTSHPLRQEYHYVHPTLTFDVVMQIARGS